MPERENVKWDRFQRPALYLSATPSVLVCFHSILFPSLPPFLFTTLTKTWLSIFVSFFLSLNLTLRHFLSRCLLSASHSPPLSPSTWGDNGNTVSHPLPPIDAKYLDRSTTWHCFFSLLFAVFSLSVFRGNQGHTVRQIRSSWPCAGRQSCYLQMQAFQKSQCLCVGLQWRVPWLTVYSEILFPWEITNQEKHLEFRKSIQIKWGYRTGNEEASSVILAVFDKENKLGKRVSSFMSVSHFYPVKTSFSFSVFLK